MARARLIEEIIKLSESDNWETAKTEWTLSTVFEEPESSCLCGQHPITENCVILNIKNNNETIVGNCCVQKFIELPSNKIFSAIKRVRKDCKRSVNEETLELAYNNKWIGDWDLKFYTSILNKRKLTPKQREHKSRINRRIELGPKRDLKDKSILVETLDDNFFLRIGPQPKTSKENTKDWLTKIGLINYPVNQLSKIEGDFKSYIKNLLNQLKFMKYYSYDLDSLGRLKKAYTDKGYFKIYNYEGTNLVSVEDSKGMTNRYSYTEGKLAQYKSPYVTISYFYNKDHLIIKEESSNGVIKASQLKDNLCVKTKIKYVSGKLEEINYDYNDSGLLMRETNSRKGVVEYTYTIIEGKVREVYQNNIKILSIPEINN